MPTPILGTQIFEIVPTIQTGAVNGGDPLTVSQGGTIPSLVGSAGAPSGSATYGTNSIGVDYTNNVLYLNQGSTTWSPLSVTTPNAVAAPTFVPTDYSYLVVSYIKIQNTFTLQGNLGIF